MVPLARTAERDLNPLAMNKTIPFSLVAFSLFPALHAQQAVQVLPHLGAIIDPMVPTATHPLVQQRATPAGTAKGLSIPLGNMANPYSMINSGPHQVEYVPGLDAVIFVRRQHGADHGNVGAGNSFRFDHSLDGGATWTLGTLLTPSMFAGTSGFSGNRYPNGCLYNPPGNTDPANAYVIAQGPVLSSTANWHSWVNASGGLTNGANAHDAYVQPWTWTSGGAINALQMAANGHAWSIGTIWDTLDLLHSRSQYQINKGTWNNSSMRMDWQVADTLKPDFFTYLFEGEGRTMALEHHITFSLDGQTGYALVTGRLEGEDLGMNTYPIVWRSTDAGATWQLQPVSDLSGQQVFIDHLEPTESFADPRPFFRTMATTMDANDHLHVFGEVLSGYYDEPDSVNWVFASYGSRILVHGISPNGTDWDFRYVDTFRNTPGLVFGTNEVQQGTHPQISRTADGTKVFMAWSVTEELEENLLPDIYARAYDTQTGMYSDNVVLTDGTPAQFGAFFFQLSPIAITGGDDHDYELPIVYLVPGATDLSPVETMYLKGVGFDEGDINVGIDERHAASRLAVYPNPSDGRFNLVLGDLDLMHNGPAELMVTDITGRMVHAQRVTQALEWLDLGGAPAGLYLLTVTADHQRLSTTIVVE